MQMVPGSVLCSFCSFLIHMLLPPPVPRAEVSFGQLNSYCIWLPSTCAVPSWKTRMLASWPWIVLVSCPFLVFFLLRVWRVAPGSCWWCLQRGAEPCCVQSDIGGRRAAGFRETLLTSVQSIDFDSPSALGTQSSYLQCTCVDSWSEAIFAQSHLVRWW